MSLPPGPRLPASLQTLAWVLRPAALMEHCRREYGDVFTLRLGPSRVVMIADPELVKPVMQGDPATLRMGDINGLFRPILGPSGLLLADGPEHMRQRKLMLPAFHGERMRGYGEAMTRIAEREVSTWPAGEPFALLPRMQSITVDVILETVFGASDPRLRSLVVELLHRCQSYSTMLPQLRRDLGGRSPWARLMRCLAQVDRLIYAEIAQRRSGRARRGDDVLSMLLEATVEDGAPMTDAELRDALLTLLVAGHATTASALAFCFERLLRHPDALARLTDELPGGGSDYLDAVIKETLRLRPVLPIVARKTTEPFALGPWDIPARSVLMPSIYLLHRHPGHWPEPEAFRPERFLGPAPSPYAFMPFGGGVRRCLGASFAQFEMRVVLRTVLTRVVLAVEPRDVGVVRRSYTCAPGRGAEAVVIRRLPQRRRFRRQAGVPAAASPAAR
ncbi:MAG: cytochrome family [Gaiellales bacterium]|nr:cytochrome family [Gaiellales bacterium]